MLILVGFVLLWVGQTDIVYAASAVAVGVGADRKVHWGFAVDAKTGENLVRNRAVGFCMAGGGLNARIIASTGHLGWGAIVMYSRPGQRDEFVAVVGAASEQDAIGGAMKKAKAAGGRTAKLARGWHDIPTATYNL